MKAVHETDTTEKDQCKAIAMQKLHINHEAERRDSKQQECSDKGCTAQFLSDGITDRRIFYTERDTDFAPRGRNKGTTVIHAVVGKFMLLWHSDEFKPIYIKERLLANPFFSPKKPYISVRTGTHQGLSKQPNMIFEEFALRRCIKNPFLTNMSLVSLAKAKVVIFYESPNNSSNFYVQRTLHVLR